MLYYIYIIRICLPQLTLSGYMLLLLNDCKDAVLLDNYVLFVVKLNL